MLQQIDAFHIRERQESTLTLGLADSSPLTLEGQSVQLQLAFKERYVLFLTGDLPYENSLHIYLLGPQLSVLDSLEISYAYASDDFSLEQIGQSNTVRFRFLLKHKSWKLSIWDKPRWTLSNPFYPMVHRKHMLFNHGYLSLTQVKRKG